MERIIQLPGDKSNFLPTAYKPVDRLFKYFTERNTDFQFIVNNAVYSGNSNWVFKAVDHFKDTMRGDGAAVTLISSDNKIELNIQFLLYPDKPVTRKNLVIKNLSEKTIQLESVDAKKLNVTGYGATTFRKDWGQ